MAQGSNSRVGGSLCATAWEANAHAEDLTKIKPAKPDPSRAQPIPRSTVLLHARCSRITLHEICAPDVPRFHALRIAARTHSA